jgi:hypothetical protein
VKDLRVVDVVVRVVVVVDVVVGLVVVGTFQTLGRGFEVGREGLDGPFYIIVWFLFFPPKKEKAKENGSKQKGLKATA